MKNSIVSLILLSIIITGCSKEGTWKDDEISNQVRKQIHELNNQVIEGFKERNSLKIFDLCSESLVEKIQVGFNEIIEMANPRFSKYDFIILHEYYQKTTDKNVPTTISYSNSGNHDYMVGFAALNKEVYVSMGYLGDDINQTLMALVYGKYGKEWKINTVQFGDLKIMGKDAFDWYESAKENYSKEYYIDAANDITLAVQTLKPANELWKYMKEDEIFQYAEKLEKEINQRFVLPMTVKYVKTKPRIFSVIPQGTDQGYYPAVYYKTNINMKDTSRLSQECDQLHSRIGELFKGIDQNNKLILYRACKEIPNTTSAYPEMYAFARNN